MNKWCEKISEWRLNKGFYTPSNIENTEERDLMLGKLMLVVTEISEGAEAVRHNNLDNFKEELADAIIRIFDICGSMKIDIEKAVEDKMKINIKRPFLHGKRCSI